MTILAALVLAQPENPFKAFDGLWKSTAGDLVVMQDSRLWQTDAAAATHTVSGSFRETPQGSWFGAWTRRKSMLAAPVTSEDYIFDRFGQTPASLAESLEGISEIMFPPPDAAGVVAQFRLQISSRRAVRQSVADYYWLGPLASLAPKGRYVGEQVALTLRPGAKTEIKDFAPGERPIHFTGQPLAGELEYAGQAYAVEAVSSGAKGQGYSYFMRSANPAFRIRFFAAPTPDQVKGWQRGQSYIPNRLVVYIGAGQGLPNGKRAVVTLQ